MMRYYSISEVAVTLKVSPEQVFTLTTGETKPVLLPSIRTDEPLSLQRIERGSFAEGEIKLEAVHENLSGVFGIDGQFLRWGKDGWASVTHHRLYKDGFSYVVLEPFSIHKDDLLFSHEDLKRYLEQRGIKLQLPDQAPDANQEEDIQTKIESSFNAEDYVKDCIKNKIPVEIIAVELSNKGLSCGKISKAIYPDRYNNQQWDARKKQGSRLVMLGKKMLKSSQE